MGKRDFRKATGLFAALVAGAALLAGVAPARADAALDAFLARSGDPQPTLALERAVAAALARNDRAWFARTARREDRPLNRALSAIETAKAAPADAVRVGPCNLAWLTLRSYVVRTARDMRAAPRTAPLAQAAPNDVANIFAEQMSRCEMIRRLPRGKRLIGVDASGA
jgi:hypothetical protein